MPAKGRPPTKMTYADRRQRRADVAAAVRGGMPLADAAAMFGLTQNAAYWACREHGLTFGVTGKVGSPTTGWGG